MSSKKSSGSTATFARCAELRQRAGLSIDDVVVRCNGRPARSSVQRLERGYAIRTHNAFRVATEINSALSEQGVNAFDVNTEVQRK